MAGLKLTGLASDSRKVKPGYLFAALAGTKTDGARFVKDAVARGAIAVMGAPALASHDAIGASIAADKTVKYEGVMNVMSDMKARGVKRVGLLVKSQ